MDARLFFQPSASTPNRPLTLQAPSSPGRDLSAAPPVDQDADTQRLAILWDFRLVLFQRWRSVQHFLQASDATAMKLGMYSWIKVFKRLEPNLNLELYAGSSEEREAFVLFHHLDIDGDGLLSEHDVCEAMAEVAPAKTTTTIRQLFLLTGAHKLHKNRDFRISGRLFRKKCAVHLDIRPRDTDEFLNCVRQAFPTTGGGSSPAAEGDVPFSQIHDFVEGKGGPASRQYDADEAAIRLALQAAFRNYRQGRTREVLNNLCYDLDPEMGERGRDQLLGKLQETATAWERASVATTKLHGKAWWLVKPKFQRAFPSVGDLVSLSQAQYHPAESIWVRYSLAQCNWWVDPKAPAVQTIDGLESPLPLSNKILLARPMIAIIPFSIAWVGGGGNGFYDLEKNEPVVQTNVVSLAPITKPEGVVRLHGPTNPGYYYVGVFGSNSDRYWYFARMVGKPAVCTVTPECVPYARKEPPPPPALALPPKPETPQPPWQKGWEWWEGWMSGSGSRRSRSAEIGSDRGEGPLTALEQRRRWWRQWRLDGMPGGKVPRREPPAKDPPDGKVPHKPDIKADDKVPPGGKVRPDDKVPPAANVPPDDKVPPITCICPHCGKGIRPILTPASGSPSVNTSCDPILWPTPGSTDQATQTPLPHDTAPTVADASCGTDPKPPVSEEKNGGSTDEATQTPPPDDTAPTVADASCETDPQPPVSEEKNGGSTDEATKTPPPDDTAPTVADASCETDPQPPVSEEKTSETGGSAGEATTTPSPDDTAPTVADASCGTDPQPPVSEEKTSEIGGGADEATQTPSPDDTAPTVADASCGTDPQPPLSEEKTQESGGSADQATQTPPPDDTAPTVADASCGTDPQPPVSEEKTPTQGGSPPADAVPQLAPTPPAVPSGLPQGSPASPPAKAEGPPTVRTPVVDVVVPGGSAPTPNADKPDTPFHPTPNEKGGTDGALVAAIPTLCEVLGVVQRDAVRDAVHLGVVQWRQPRQGRLPVESPWWPALFAAAVVLLLTFMGSGGHMAPTCVPSNTTSESCQANATSSAAAVGCALGRAAEELVSDVTDPASPRQGCQSACALAEYAETSPLNRDVLISRGAVPAVVGRLAALQAGDRPTTLSLLHSLRPLCANSSLARDALRAAGGVQTLAKLAVSFATDPLVLSTVSALQQFLFPPAPSESPSASPSESLSPSQSFSPSLSLSPSNSPSPSPNASLSPSPASEPPVSNSPANWSLSASPVPSPSPSVSTSPQPSPSLLTSSSPLPSLSPGSSVSPNPSPSPSSSHSSKASGAPSGSPAPSPSRWPSPGSPIVNLNHSIIGEPSVSLSPSSSPTPHPSPSPADLSEEDDQCWEQCQQLANSTTEDTSPADNSSSDDSALESTGTAGCLSYTLTSILFALFFAFAALWTLAILLVVFCENWAAKRTGEDNLQRPYSCLMKLLLNHLQVLCLLGTIAVPWPAYMGVPLGALNAVFNVDVNFLAFNCFTGLSDIGRAVVYACVPIAVALLAVAAFAALWGWYACCQRRRVPRSVCGWFITLLLLLAYIVYPVSLRHFIALLPCPEEEGSIAHCFTATRLGMFIVSVVYIAAWGVVLPGWALRALHRRKLADDLQTSEAVDRLGWLFAGYQPSSWYWEFVIHIRKLAVCVAVAGRPGGAEVQLLAVLGLLGLALLLHATVAPHEDDDDNQMETFSLGTILLSSWLALMYTQVTDLPTTVAISVAFLVLNVLCLLLFVFAARAHHRGVRADEDAGFRSLASAWRAVEGELRRRMEASQKEQPEPLGETPAAPDSPTSGSFPDPPPKGVARLAQRLHIPPQLVDSVGVGISGHSAAWDKFAEVTDKVVDVADTFLEKQKEQEPTLSGISDSAIPGWFGGSLSRLVLSPAAALRPGTESPAGAEENAPALSPAPLLRLPPQLTDMVRGGASSPSGETWGDYIANFADSPLGRSALLRRAPARVTPMGPGSPTAPPAWPGPSTGPARERRLVTRARDPRARSPSPPL